MKHITKASYILVLICYAMISPKPYEVELVKNQDKHPHVYQKIDISNMKSIAQDINNQSTLTAIYIFIMMGGNVMYKPSYYRYCDFSLHDAVNECIPDKHLTTLNEILQHISTILKDYKQNRNKEIDPLLIAIINANTECKSQDSDDVMAQIISMNNNQNNQDSRYINMIISKNEAGKHDLYKRSKQMINDVLQIHDSSSDIYQLHQAICDKLLKEIECYQNKIEESHHYRSKVVCCMPRCCIMKVIVLGAITAIGFTTLINTPEGLCKLIPYHPCRVIPSNTSNISSTTEGYSGENYTTGQSTSKQASTLPISSTTQTQITTSTTTSTSSTATSNQASTLPISSTTKTQITTSTTQTTSTATSTTSATTTSTSSTRPTVDCLAANRIWQLASCDTMPHDYKKFFVYQTAPPDTQFQCANPLKTQPTSILCKSETKPKTINISSIVGMSRSSCRSYKECLSGTDLQKCLDSRQKSVIVRFKISPTIFISLHDQWIQIIGGNALLLDLIAIVPTVIDKKVDGAASFMIWTLSRTVELVILFLDHESYYYDPIKCPIIKAPMSQLIPNSTSSEKCIVSIPCIDEFNASEYQIALSMMMSVIVKAGGFLDVVLRENFNLLEQISCVSTNNIKQYTTKIYADVICPHYHQNGLPFPTDEIQTFASFSKLDRLINSNLRLDKVELSYQYNEWRSHIIEFLKNNGVCIGAGDWYIPVLSYDKDSDWWSYKLDIPTDSTNSLKCHSDILLT